MPGSVQPGEAWQPMWNLPVACERGLFEGSVIAQLVSGRRAGLGSRLSAQVLDQVEVAEHAAIRGPVDGLLAALEVGDRARLGAPLDRV